MPANNPLAYLMTDGPDDPGSSPKSAPTAAKTAESSGDTEIPDELNQALIQQESSGNPDAVSPDGAVGLAQSMPQTARDPGYGVDPLENPRDPEQARRFSKEYLGAMMDEFNNPEEALMAYNWGPGNVKKWKASGADPSKVPQETREYVQELLPVAARTMDKPVESTIMGKRVGDEDRKQARKTRERVRKEMMKEEIARSVPPDGTSVGVPMPTGGSGSVGMSAPEVESPDIRVDSPSADGTQTSQGGTPPPPAMGDGTSIPPNQTQ